MEVAAAVVGMLAAGAQVSSILQQFISSAVNAPELAQSLNYEIRNFMFVLSKLQPIILGSTTLNKSRASMIDIDHLSFTLTGCVCTFSLLEKEVDRIKSKGKMDFWDRVKWARAEATLGEIVQRLQNEKLSLMLILTVLTCETPAEAENCQQNLNQLLTTGTTNTSQSSLVHSLQTASGSTPLNTNDDQYSISGDSAYFDSRSIMTASSTSTVTNKLYRLAFQSTLDASRPYLRTLKRPQSMLSLDSFERNPRWSLYTGRSGDSVLSLPVSLQRVSGITLAEAPNLSSVSLPITPGSLYNYRRYSTGVIDGSSHRASRILPLAPILSRDRKHALHLATLAGDTEKVRRLLFWGTDPDARNRDGDTPLLVAARDGHEAIALLLLDKGANKDAKDISNDTPLSLAAFYGYESVVLLLLERGANVAHRNDRRDTPLHHAARKGHAEIARHLLDWGADKDAKDISNNTPLNLAAFYGHESVVLLLLERGANVAHRNDRRDTPLHDAAIKGHAEIARHLLDWGADKDVKDFINNTSLTLAAMNGHESVVLLLLERGANVANGDNGGNTPLHHAAIKGHAEIARHLLDWGADKDVTNKFSSTPLTLAAKNGHDSVVLLLLKRGANIANMNYSRDTPLTYAVQNNHESTTKLLREWTKATDNKANIPPTLAQDTINPVVEGQDTSLGVEACTAAFFQS